MIDDADIQSLLEASPDVLSRHNAEGVYLYVSPACSSVLGLDRDDLLGKPLWTICNPHDAPEAKMALAAAASGEGATHATLRVRGKDGGERFIEMTARAEQGRDKGASPSFACAMRDISARTEEHLELLRKAQLFSARLDNLIMSIPGIVWESWGKEDPAQLHVNFVSDYVSTMPGYAPEAWKGRPDFWLHIMHPDDREQALREGREAFERGHGSSRYRWITKDNRTIWVETHQRVMYDEAGAPAGFRGVSMDISARHEAEEEQAKLRDEIIRAQAEALAELSTPLIPINDHIMVMPLVGALDPGRAERVIQTLLTGMVAARARVAILDITGVPNVDAQSASALLRAARAVELLGASVVLTGIRPEVAQTLVTIGADLGRIVTRGTLQAGIAYAMVRLS